MSDKSPVDAPDTLQEDPAALFSEPYKLAVNKLVSPRVGKVK